VTPSFNDTWLSHGHAVNYSLSSLSVAAEDARVGRQKQLISAACERDYVDNHNVHGRIRALRDGEWIRNHTTG